MNRLWSLLRCSDSRVCARPTKPALALLTRKTLPDAVQFGLFCILVTQAVMYFARQGHGLEDSRLFRLYIAVVLAATTLVLF